MVNGDNPNDWLQEADVTLGGLPFATVGQAHAYTGLYVNGLSGWWGLPDLKGTAFSNPVSDGDLPRTSDQLRRSSRVLTLTGSVSGPDYGTFNSRRSRLIGALSQPGLKLSVAMPNLQPAQHPLELSVEVASLSIVENGAKPVAKLTVDLVAPNPLKTTQPILTDIPPGSSKGFPALDVREYPAGGSLTFLVQSPTSLKGSLSIASIVRQTAGTQQVLYEKTDMQIVVDPALDISWVSIDPDKREVLTSSGDPVQFRFLEGSWPSLTPVLNTPNLSPSDSNSMSLIAGFSHVVNGQNADSVLTVSYYLRTW